jgi:hypothetical protein
MAIKFKRDFLQLSHAMGNMVYYGNWGVKASIETLKQQNWMLARYF